MNVDLTPTAPAGSPLPRPRSYQAQWASDVALFTNVAARTPANFWTDGTLVSQVRRFTVALPRAQWNVMKAGRHIYFRVGAGESADMTTWQWSVTTDWVVNHMPTADAGLAASVPVASGTPLAADVALDASASQDPDGGTLTYTWTLDSPPASCFDQTFIDAVRARLTGTAAQVTPFSAGLTLPQSCEGTYVFSVEVVDNDPPSFSLNTRGKDSAQTRVTIGSCINAICIDNPTGASPARLVRPGSTDVEIFWRMDAALHQQLQSLYAGNHRLRMRVIDAAAGLGAVATYEQYEVPVPAAGSFLWPATLTNGAPAPAATYDVEVALVDVLDAPISIPGFVTAAIQSAAIVLDEFKAKILRRASTTFARLGAPVSVSYQVTAPEPADAIELVFTGPAGTTRIAVAGLAGVGTWTPGWGGPHTVTVEVSRGGAVVATSAAHEFYVLPDPLAPPSSSPVGSTTYTAASDAAAPAAVKQVVLAAGDGYVAATTVDIAGAVWYPATAAGIGTTVAAGAHPLVLMVHGNHRPGVGSYTGFEYLGRHLASQGFIAASVDMDVLNGGAWPSITHRARVINANLSRWIWKAASDPRFTGKVDLANISLIGHSRGGEAVVQAVKIGVPAGVTIRALVSIAPTDFLSLVNTGPPYLAIYGSADGDVFTAHGFRIYDRSSARKAQVYVYGATHNDFCEHVDWPTERTEAAPSRIAAPATTRAAAKAWINAFLQWVVNARSHYAFYFDAQNTPPALRALDPGRIYVKSVELIPNAMIDRFVTPPIGAADAGAAVTAAPAGSLSPFSEQSFAFTDGPPTVYTTPHMQQDTSGGLLGWIAAAKYVITLGSVNASAYRVLTARVAQALSAASPPADPNNPAGVAKNAKVTIGDGTKTATLDFASFTQAVPYPYVRRDLPTGASPLTAADAEQSTLAPLQNVRIPLWAFTEVEPKLDLTKVATVSFDFTGTGLVAVDDIGFSP